jgi:outer membrane receptor protein involved in Fe transport
MRLKLFYIFAILQLMINVFLIAGETGKIKGTVKDKKTGEPLIGANVLIKGTNLGAATDANGNYFILRVPPGTYDIVFSYIGYRSVTIKGVIVKSDLTTEVNVEMESSEIQLEPIEVSAEQKTIQKDVTSTRRTVSRQEILEIPGMEFSSDIFKLQGGVVSGVIPQLLILPQGTQLQLRDESVKDVHIRGGRGGDVLFLIDGMPVTHPLYGGRSVLELNVVDVSEVELLTGGFNAEYGQAQSGVVNIITRGGSKNLTGGFEYKTDKVKIFSDIYDTHYGSLYLSGPLLYKNLTFFLSTSGQITNTPYNNNRTRQTINLFNLLKFKERQDNSLNLTGKIEWDVSNAVKLGFSYFGNWKRWSDFNWLWKFYPDHSASYNRYTSTSIFTLTHILSSSTYYTLRLGYLSVSYKGSLNGKTPADFWVIKRNENGEIDSIYSTIKQPQFDPLTGFYDEQGYESIWRDDKTSTYTIKFDLTSQIHPEHLMKTGFELQYHDLKYVDIQDGGANLSYYGEYLYKNGSYSPKPPGPFPEFGKIRWFFHSYPSLGSFYIQDKFEKEILIINMGLRMDWFMLGTSIDNPDWKKQWEEATGLKADWNGRKIRYKISPRFGISFPISENMVMFFSYGHFYQLPELQFFYRDPYTGSFTGNPKLDYEQTILYEFGLTSQPIHNWLFDIKVYAKDIAKQVGTIRLLAAMGRPVDLYDNNGYARARGIEIKIGRQPIGHLFGDITYTLQWANGYSSSSFEDYIRSITDFPNPIRERRLAWDLRHQIILNISLSSPKNKPINLLGFKLPDNWQLTVLSRVFSGYPYTPWTSDPAEAQVKENTATGPLLSSTDIKFIKSFNIGKIKLSLQIDAYNIFNQRNIQIAYGFNTYIGKPFRYGDIKPPTNQYYDWFEIYRLMDPRQFEPLRNVRIGFRIDF